MRVWLDPQKVAQRNLTASEIVTSIQEQNIQVAAGAVGAAPSSPGTAVQLTINAQGRLKTVDEFRNIVLKTSPNGAVTHLRDVARVELSAAEYGLRALLDNKPAVSLAIYQLPGANALEISDQIRAALKDLSADFPPGLDYRLIYDPTRFVKSSIQAVIETLLEAIALVVVVVIVFLQSWRTAIIPLIAVPVSIIGTFALLLAFGFSINALSLFGMVLAIGIVVDDAIVVVENVERNIASGLTPRTPPQGQHAGCLCGSSGSHGGYGNVVPAGFIPMQDKEYLVTIAQLPNGASLDRTEEVIRQMSEIVMKQPGAAHAVGFPGMSVNGFMNSSSAGIVFVPLKPLSERTSKDESAAAIVASLNQKFASIKGAYVAAFPPPPILGLGTLGGFKMQLEDQGSLGYEELNKAAQAFMAKAAVTPELGGSLTNYQINFPQLNVELDRVKAKQLGVSVTDVFKTMQVYLGSLYVNDFNSFGRVYQVRVQADAPFRQRADDILQLKTRNDRGEMVPLSSLVRITPTYGPDMVVRYNGYTAADINGGPAPGYSSGQAQAAAERIAAEVLPQGVKFEWTELTYQKGFGR
ncbi:unnamed protein product, partial [Mesorhabditis spiculigera]